MIPILYEKNEVDFTTFGVCILADTISCSVTEELNGGFELTLTYPMTGRHYDQLEPERIIKAKASDSGDDQLFRIYRITRPLKGIVTVYAQHISYDLSGIPITPFAGSYTCANALAYLFAGTAFTGTSDKTGTKTVSTAEPKSARAMLGGTEGSLLDLWGGEYTFNNYTISLNTRRGSDNGVLIAYGKNLTGLDKDDDFSSVYTELLPYATYSDADGNDFIMTAPTIPITSVISREKALIKDFAEIMGLEPGDTPTQAQITAAANAWLSDNPLGIEKPSLTITFQPPGTPGTLNAVALGDTVTVRHEALGVDLKARIVETQFNTITERFDKAVIGRIKASLIDTVMALETQEPVRKTDTQNFVVTDGTHTTKVMATGITTDGVGYLPLNGGTMTGQVKTSFKDSVATGSYQATATTVPNLVAEVRYSSGVVGSVSISTAYTSGGYTIPTGWYNFSYMPHRSGGVNGSASGDNCNYGTLLLAGMTISNQFFRIRVASGAIAEVKQISEGGERVSSDGTQVSLASGTTPVQLASFSLTAGIWQVNLCIKFGASATGRRLGQLSTSTAGTEISQSWICQAAPVNGGSTWMHWSHSLAVSSATTYYIFGYQNSGGALATTAMWDCVRIR